MFLRHLAIAAALFAPVTVQASEVPIEGTGAVVPDDIWSGSHGGFPSFGASSANGVSVELPARALQEAGGAPIAQFAKNFLDRWGPHMCSDAFDFQSPHKHLRMMVALMQEMRLDATTFFYVPDKYREIFIDYEPIDKVHCVRPSDIVS